MIRVVLLFAILFFMFFGAIKFIQKMTGKEALALTKILGYSILCSVLSIAVLVGLVILF